MIGRLAIAIAILIAAAAYYFKPPDCVTVAREQLAWAYSHDPAEDEEEFKERMGRKSAAVLRCFVAFWGSRAGGSW